jgi:hypothetical protein
MTRDDIETKSEIISSAQNTMDKINQIMYSLSKELNVSSET